MHQCISLTMQQKYSLPTLSLLFSPPNTTSKLQPLDAGIIWSFKANSRKFSLLKLLSVMDNHLDTGMHALVMYSKFHNLDAMRFAIQAWEQVTTSAIKAC